MFVRQVESARGAVVVALLARWARMFPVVTLYMRLALAPSRLLVSIHPPLQLSKNAKDIAKLPEQVLMMTTPKTLTGLVH
jgi:hypothetical protein